MFCNYCGNPNPDVAKFCRKCGKPVVDSPRLSAAGSGVAVAATPVNSPHVEPAFVEVPLSEVPQVEPSERTHVEPALVDAPLVDDLDVEDPIVGAPDVDAPAADAPLIDDPPVSAAVAEDVHGPVTTLARVSSAPTGAEPGGIRSRNRAAVIAVAASLVLLSIGGLIFMRVRSGRPRTLDIQVGFISSIAFSPDGGQLVVTGSDGSGAQLWDTARLQWLRTFNSYSNTDWVAFSPDGHTVATWGQSSGHVVVLWDAQSGNQIRVLGQDGVSLGEAAFSPDSRLLVTDAYSQGSDGGLRLWDAGSGSELRRFPGYLEPVFSPDGKLLAAWNKSGSISLLDVGSGNEVRTFNGHKGFLIPEVIFSPDGRLLASTNENSMVTVWDLATGNEVRRIHDSAMVRGIAFSRDSRLLASGSEDNTIKLWDVASGNKVRTLAGHSRPVNCVVFSPDGRVLASGGADGKVMLWPLPQSR